MDKTHGESSFESASSLYSSKGEMLSEDIVPPDDYQRETKSRMELNLNIPLTQVEVPKKSPTHSVSSTSSGSYNVGEDGEGKTPDKEKVSPLAKKEITSPIAQPRGEPIRIKKESVSDDERSEVRYSSSGYYESPHDDEYQKLKSRRYRQEEERKRRKTSMKIDIEKENMRALTSPIKRDQLKKSPERHKASTLAESTSPIKIKRFRPKIRRQLRRSSRDEGATRQRKTNAAALSPQQGSAEKLLDVSIMSPKPTVPTQTVKDTDAYSPPPPPARIVKEHSVTTTIAIVATKSTTSLSPAYVKSASETCQLKAKSIESLNRSVSPGSDSVFYSEADGNHADHHSGHCSHCGKEVEEPSVVGDSVESLPYIDNEPDIVKPPSDFADSPVTSKTPQRLYKKMDKRFRSEERYHLERGRHYKSRKDNIRAKVS